MRPPIAPGYSYDCDFSLAEAIGQLVIWVLLVVVTLGLALFVLPYYFLKAPINRTWVLDPSGARVGRLVVDVSLGGILWHAVLWLLLTIITLGLAYLVYWQSVMKRLMNATRVVPV